MGFELGRLLNWIPSGRDLRRDSCIFNLEAGSFCSFKKKRDAGRLSKTPYYE